MSKELFNSNETTMYNIFDIIHAYLVKNYSCGINSYHIDELAKESDILLIRFFSDGMLIFKGICKVSNLESMQNEFIVSFMNGQNIIAGETFSISEIKNILLNGEESVKYKNAIKLAKKQLSKYKTIKHK